MFGVDMVFNPQNGVVTFSEDKYTNMISTTSEGASVKMGQYNSLLAQLG